MPSRKQPRQLRRLWRASHSHRTLPTRRGTKARKLEYEAAGERSGLHGDLEATFVGTQTWLTENERPVLPGQCAGSLQTAPR